ncbi:sensor histidine kinase [Jatrophihabitans fulvus]
MTRRRTTLATRIALLSVAIVVVTAVVAGFLATGLIRTAGDSSGRRLLARIADISQGVAEEPRGRARVLRALAGANVRAGVVTADGTLRSRSAVVRRVVTPQDVTRLRSGRDLSAVRTSGDATVFVEGRAVAGGRAVVLVQAKRDATAADERAIRRLVLALLVAGAVAALLGLLVAWRLARPLRRAAAAAHAVAAGHRDVVLPAAGPREVAEVGAAVTGIATALTRSEARQREFLLSVSHDLRTPLTAITGYAESLAEGVVPADDTARVGDAMRREAHRLDRLVGDLLDLARLGAQDFRVDVAPVELVALADDAARVWADRSAATGVELRYERPDGPVRTVTDAARVRQVLDGLFDNALRVTPGGRPVVLAVRDEAGAAVVEVRDGGPGLTDDDLAVAFEQGALFRRYRGVREVGTGLGLAIVHRLVTRLGGSVEAGHAVEGGARFTVRLPSATSSEAPAAAGR